MCVLVSLMIGFYGKLRFKNIGTMFSQRGKVCNSADHLKSLLQFRRKSEIYPTAGFTVQESLSVF